MGIVAFLSQHAAIVSILAALITVIGSLLLKDILLPVCKAALDAVVRAAARRLTHAQFRERYLAAMSRLHHPMRLPKISQSGLMQTGLPQVYLPMRLREPDPKVSELDDEDSPDEDGTSEPESLRGPMSSPFFSGRRVRIIMSAYGYGFTSTRLVETMSQLVHRPQKETIAHWLRDGAAQLHIIGPRGAGKTTLLSHLILTLTGGMGTEALGLHGQWVPILISLGDLKKDVVLTADSLKELCVPTPLRSKCPDDFFEKLLQDGHGFIMLDAGDEGGDGEQRAHAVSQIEAFVATYPGNRYIATSRPGDDCSFVLPGFKTLELCPLEPKESELLAQRWIGDSDLLASFQRAVDTPRLKSLTRNPLMLTIMLMLFIHKGILPKRETDLYRQCLDVLLDNPAERALAPVRDVALRTMSELALRMHRSRTQYVAEAEILKTAGDVLKRENAARHVTPQACLNALYRRHYVLLRQGHRYRLPHLAFQEYLAACRLADLGRKGLQELIRWRREPWWHGVLSMYMLVGDGNGLVEALVSKKHTWDIGDLRLAARLLLLPEIALPTADRVVDLILGALRNSAARKERNEMSDMIFRLGAADSPCRQVVLMHLPSLLSCSDEWVRCEAASLLSELGSKDEALLATCEAALRSANPSTRLKASGVLCDLGHVAPVIQLLDTWTDADGFTIESVVYDLVHSGVRQALEALLDRLEYRGVPGQLGRASGGHPWLIEEIVRRLRDATGDVRKRLVDALREAPISEPMVVTTLADHLVDPDETVRGACLWGLGRCERLPPRAVSLMFAALADPSGRVRHSAAIALGHMSRRAPGIRRRLLRAMRPGSKYLRAGAALAIGESGVVRSQGEINRLIALTQSSSPLVRSSAVCGLLGAVSEEMDRWDAELAQVLPHCLRDPDVAVRVEAVYGLTPFSLLPDWLKGALIDRLHSDESPEVRRGALYALGHSRGSVDEQVVSALADRLDDPNPGVRAVAAEQLGRKKGMPVRLAMALSARLQLECEPGVRRALLEGFGFLGWADERVLKLLVAFLTDDVHDVRLAAAYALRRLRETSEATGTLLLELLSDSSQLVREGAAVALTTGLQFGQFTPQQIGHIKDLLRAPAGSLLCQSDQGSTVTDVARFLLLEHDDTCALTL